MKFAWHAAARVRGAGLPIFIGALLPEDIIKLLGELFDSIVGLLPGDEFNGGSPWWVLMNSITQTCRDVGVWCGRASLSLSFLNLRLEDRSTA